MAQGLIRVTPSELIGLASQLRAGAKSIADTLTQLGAKVAPLRGGDWIGDGATRFECDFQEWHRSAQHLNQALEDMATLFSRVAAEYQRSDDQAAARLSGHGR